MRVIWENLRSTSSNNQHPHPHFNPLYIFLFFIYIHTYIIYKYVINTFIYIPLFVSGGLVRIHTFFIFFVARDFQHFSWSISSHLSSSHGHGVSGYRRRRCIQPAQCDGRSGLRGAFACCWRRQRARRRRTTHAGRWDVVFKDTPGKAWMMMRSGMYIQWGMILMNIDDCVKFSWISMIVLNSDGCRL